MKDDEQRIFNLINNFAQNNRDKNEVSITKGLAEELKASKNHKKAMFQNEVSYSQIAPSLMSNELYEKKRLDLSCFYGGKFHFIEYKHINQQKGGDSNLAIIRAALTDLRKLETLRNSESEYINFKIQDYSFCSFVFDGNALNIHNDSLVSAEKAISFWRKHPEVNNTERDLKKVNNAFTGMTALMEYIQKDSQIPFGAKCINNKGGNSSLFVFSTIFSNIQLQ